MSTRCITGVARPGLLAILAACGHGVVPGPATGASPAAAATAPIPARAGARSGGPPTNGLEVIGWMRYAHPSRDLKSLAFTVSTTDYRSDSSVLARSRAYAALPGRMRVNLLPSSSRSGSVRDRRRLAVFESGRRVSTWSGVDLTVLLAYDVYAQGIDTTILFLDSSRVRFGLLRRDRFQGRDVWVVGAMEGDTTSEQYWVDAERWLVVRVIQREPRAPAILSDIRFTEYAEFLDVPVPMRIEVHRDGRLVQRQEISDVAVNPVLPARTFDLSRWRDVNLAVAP